MSKPNRKPQGTAPPATRPVVWICLALIAAVLLVYAPVVHFGFVSYDDPDYVIANPQVQSGLTAAGVVWALSTSYAGNWFPLTWLSHMLDCELFGQDAGWHHAVNVLMHCLGVLAWFALFYQLTGARWKSALLAMLFALHPLHVESVAWVAERKDVLSGLLCALTLWSYARYTKRPGAGRYIATLVLFCLGLMSKSMLVTLPVLLLLLDAWPLKRGLRIVEKLPFFALSAVASVVAFLAHQRAGATASLELIPLAARMENALVSYVVYLWKMVWPVDLAVFYPYPAGSMAVPAAVCGVVLIAITWLALRQFRVCPYLATGWLWYLVTLLPVIGLVQVGGQARADRYTYLPMIGIALAVIWLAGEFLDRQPRAGVAVAAFVLLACAILTRTQLAYWQDSVALYQHAIDVTSDNYLARINLASALEERGQTADAVAQLRETVRIRPRMALAHAELGQLLAKEDQTDEALRELQTAVSLNGDLADAHFRLGTVLGKLGRTREASDAFAQTIRLQPGNGDAHYNLAMALAQDGKLPEAEREFREAARLKPDDADARLGLGIALAKQGRLDDAIEQFSQAVRLQPGNAGARQALEQAMQEKRGR